MMAQITGSQSGQHKSGEHVMLPPLGKWGMMQGVKRDWV